ncbi:outer membrane beta-barrel protein [Paracoccus sp. S1E-3]|uniref:outer membrane protein n=1 Tax=Paracoccus sp. S1E-3 TaxID=2756130 RepID=UPI0015EEC803|nr:outer membrane beta-barrel protein [Paracoccus sp. S1E-3]MBA4492304.1 porin family protein [Paracoccus sp. S1E-3]
MKINAFLFTSAAVLTGSAAFAGGYIAPVVQEVVPVVEVAQAPLWAGGYVGGTLGYAFQGEDRVGYHETATATNAERFLGDAGELKLKGVNGGIRAGYRWQRDAWVFGPELSFDFGSIEDSTSGRLTPGGYVPFEMKTESKVKNVAALVLKGGYLVKPDLLLFTKAGVARADIEYRASFVDDDGDTGSGEADFKKTGYIVGVGLEKRVSEKLSVSGEYEYANFGKETREFGALHTEATPKYHNIKIGVNYRF